MSTLRNPPAGGGRRARDPLGKQAVFSPPEEIIDLAAIETPFDVAEAHALTGDEREPDVIGATGESGDTGASTADAAPAGHRRQPLALECSTCGTTTDVSLVDFALAHLPVGIWLPLPGWRFNRYATCPACHKLTWLRAHLGR